MDHIVAAIQQAALQQQISMMEMQMPYHGHHMNAMNFIGGGYGYGPQTAQLPPPPLPPMNNGTLHVAEHEDDDDEEQSRTLFCNNLDERVTEEILYEVFIQAGPIESARIPLDNMGRQRNFGFITYQHKCAVAYAVELYQGLELYQKKITIRQQVTDKPKPSQMTGQSTSRNTFVQEVSPPTPKFTHQPRVRHARHTMIGLSTSPNKYNNNDLRRRSDSAVVDWKRPRIYQQQQHINSGGNRRSDQRFNHGKRRLL